MELIIIDHDTRTVISSTTKYSTIKAACVKVEKETRIDLMTYLIITGEVNSERVMHSSNCHILYQEFPH